jgi:hypothetical protein
VGPFSVVGPARIAAALVVNPPRVFEVELVNPPVGTLNPLFAVTRPLAVSVVVVTPFGNDKGKAKASAGAAAVSCAVMDCDAPEIVSVTEKLCGPVPSGGGTPGAMRTENVHCVAAGVIRVLSWTFSVKLPFLSS